MRLQSGVIAQNGDTHVATGESSRNMSLVTHRETAQINTVNMMEARFLIVKDGSYKYRKGEN